MDNFNQQCGQQDPHADMVQLLQTVKFPAGCKNIVREQIRGSLMDAVMMFMSTLDVPALQLADGVLEG